MYDHNGDEGFSALSNSVADWLYGQSPRPCDVGGRNEKNMNLSCYADIESTSNGPPTSLFAALLSDTEFVSIESKE